MNEIFYGTSGPRDARIAIVGESWGTNERELQLPFVGQSGKELDKIMAEAGMPDRSQIFMTNVVPEQPIRNEMHTFFYPTGLARKQHMEPTRGLYPRPNVMAGVVALKKQLAQVKPDIIIGFGNYTLWALTEDSFSVADHEGHKVPRGIGWWRGSQLFVNIDGRQVPFLPTYHPAAVFKTWPWRYLIKHDLGARVVKHLGKIEEAWTPPEWNFVTRPGVSVALNWINTMCDIADAHILDLAVDIETRGRTFISCIGLAASKQSAICIPFTCVDRFNYFTEEEELQVVLALRRLLTHPNVRIIGQNFLYDLQYILPQLFCLPKLSFDTMLMHHVCWPGGGSPESKAYVAGLTRKDLSSLSSFYCAHHRYWKDEGKNWEPWMGDEQHWVYNCTDAVRTFEVKEELQSLIVSLGLETQAQFQMDVANEVALEMMLNGVLIDTKRRAEIALELAARMDEYQLLIDSLIPEDVWPRDPKKKTWVNSPTQQMSIFYDELGVKPVMNRKTKKPTVNKEALSIIAKREPILGSLIRKIEEFRKVGAAYSKGTQAKLEPDGKMRCMFNPAGTETFRFNSYENAFGRGTNMQNISKGTEDDLTARVALPNIRKFFIPDPGYEIADFDLSGADAQVVAWEAEDEDLKAAFRAGLKLHIVNARTVWPDETRDMSDEDLKLTDHPGGMYYNCKRRAHGYNYGSSAKTMAVATQTPIREEEEFKERWFHLHPGIKLWHQRYERYLRGEQCWNCDVFPETNSGVCSECGVHLGRTIKNLFGFRVVYFDRIDGLLPQALAWTPQSTVALVTTKGALALRRQLPWIKLLMHGHDSLVTQYEIERRSQLHEIKEILHSVQVPYPDPLTIPWGATASTISWGDVETVQNW